MNERIFRGQMIRPRPADNSGDIYRPDNGINPQPIESMSGYSSPVEFYNIDITTAHVDFAIRVPKCMYIQTVCDGISDGISIKLIDQSREAFPLDKVKTIPSPGINRIYMTNDVRQGRSKLTIMFWQTEPAGLSDQAQNITLAEAAVRNGSIVSFDRRGEVIFQDSFENSLAGWYLVTVAGANVTLSTTYCLSGALSAKMVTPAAINGIGGMQHGIPVTTPKKIGIEIASYLADAINLKDFYFGLTYQDGANACSGYLKYDHVNGKLQYMNSAGAWVDIATSAFTVISAYFRRFKLVIDYEKNEYVRAIVNGKEYDLSNIAIPQSVSVGEKRIVVSIYMATANAAGSTLYFDDVIITQNEP